jgi:hypothetical protein
MTNVDHGKSKRASAQGSGMVQVEPNQPGPALVDCSKGWLTNKPDWVEGGLEETLGSAFGLVALRLVFGQVGHDVVVEPDFGRLFGIDRPSRIEERTSQAQPQALDGFERRLGMALT